MLVASLLSPHYCGAKTLEIKRGAPARGCSFACRF